LRELLIAFFLLERLGAFGGFSNPSDVAGLPYQQYEQYFGLEDNRLLFHPGQVTCCLLSLGCDPFNPPFPFLFYQTDV